jgi:branched-chain amino acid transport system permease protein
MGSSSLSFKHIMSLLLIPVWTAVLALPFTGFANALELGAVALVLIVLWRTARLDVIASILRTFRERVSRHPFPFSPALSLPGTRGALLLLVVFLIILPVFLNDYSRDVMTLTCLYIILALGLNIVVGQAGLLNLGYVAFYAIGAYTYAILSTVFGLSFWPGLAVGALAAAFFAVVIGLPTLTLRGDYFAIVTLGLGEITRIVLNNWDGMTGGPNGISKIGRPVIAGYVLHSTMDFYYLVLFLAALTVFAMQRLIVSRIGRAWIAIREDEVAAEAMGIDTFRLKLLAFVIGSAWAGMAGVFFASKMAFVSPESFTFFESVMILCMVVLGGMGSIPGIVLGALLLITLPELFRDFQDYRMLAFGIALVLMMIFRPQGLLGTPKTGKA